MYNPGPFAVNPRETIERLKACATVVLGYRPSPQQATATLLHQVMKDRQTDSASMLEMARELFPVSNGCDERPIKKDGADAPTRLE